MEKNSCYLNILWLLLSLNVGIQSTESEMNYIPAPTNITAKFSSPFEIIVTWEPIDANCTPDYEIVTSIQNKDKKAKEKKSFYQLEISKGLPTLHVNYLSVGIQANCNGMKSEWARRSHMQLAPGDEGTSVKNLSCVWYYDRDIECTWQPGDKVLPNAQYKLLYWREDNYTENLPNSTQFQDLLRTGNECQDYFPSGGMYLGCKFTYRHSSTNQFMFVVTDTSYSIKPFFYYTPVINIGKLQSPNITYVSKLINNHLDINWTVPFKPNLLNCKIQVSSDSWMEPFEIETEHCCSVNVHIPHSDDTMRVKVQIQFSKYVGGNMLWSDWSEERIVQGKDNNNTTFLLLLILIPVVVLVITVLLLVYLKRLKILVCPPIPHPGKIFQNDLQLWLKQERPTNIYDKPEQEDISPVSLLEV